MSGLQAETAQKVLSLPAAPGSLILNTAAHLHGIMVYFKTPLLVALQSTKYLLRLGKLEGINDVTAGATVRCTSKLLQMPEVSL